MRSLWWHRISGGRAAGAGRPQDLSATLQAVFWQGPSKFSVEDPLVGVVLFVQIAINGVRSHSHRTRTQWMTAERPFAVREVPPALCLTEPFPTVLVIQSRASAAHQFYVAVAHQFIHWAIP
jgi:hypothetical protein